LDFEREQTLGKEKRENGKGKYLLAKQLLILPPSSLAVATFASNTPPINMLVIPKYLVKKSNHLHFEVLGAI
jgi:hypothetical protein